MRKIRNLERMELGDLGRSKHELLSRNTPDWEPKGTTNLKKQVYLEHA